MRTFGSTTLILGLAGMAWMGLGVGSVFGACVFTFAGTAMDLQGDCTTDATISIPDGFTLDGQGFTITAIPPMADDFKGGIVENEGSVAHVKNLTVEASGLANACKGGDDRLRGILFAGASGSILHTQVVDVNKGASGCQEGNGIEVRNAPFDGSHPDTQSVEIAHNEVDRYQKGGIICNGDMECHIHHNDVGASVTQAHLTANAVQLGFGATGLVEHNHISGNQNNIPGGADQSVGTAVLLFESQNSVVKQNNISGNSNVGVLTIIGIFASLANPELTVVQNNRIFDKGPDTSMIAGQEDIGIAVINDISAGTQIVNNKVRGYDDPVVIFSGGDDIQNKIIPNPHDLGEACFLPDTSPQNCTPSVP